MKKRLFLVIFFLFLCLDSLSEGIAPYTINPFGSSHCLESFAVSVEGYDDMLKHPSKFTHRCYTTDYHQASEMYFNKRTYKGSFNAGGGPAPYRAYHLGDGSSTKNRYGSFLLKDGRELKGVYYEYFGSWIKGKIDGLGILVFPNGSHYAGFFTDGKFDGPGFFTIDFGKFDDEIPIAYEQYNRLTNQGEFSKKNDNSITTSDESTIMLDFESLMYGDGTRVWKPICDYSFDSTKWDDCIGKKYLFKPDVLEDINDKTVERRAEYIENYKFCKSGKGRTESPKCLTIVDMVVPGGILKTISGKFKNNMPSSFDNLYVYQKSTTNRKDVKHIVCWGGNLNKYGFLEGENTCTIIGKFINEAILGNYLNGKPNGTFKAYKEPTSSEKHLPLRERQPVFIGEYDTDFNRALGISYKKNGKVEYDGEWGGFHNKPHGYGEFFYNDGTKYKGEFKNGKKHGKGTLTSLNGKITTGRYENGKKVGRHIEINY